MRKDNNPRCAGDGVHLRRVVAWATLLPPVILLVERASLFSQLGAPWWAYALNALFLAPTLLGYALMARGFWLLPEARGRGFLAGGLLAQATSLFASTLIVAAQGSVVLFALPAVYLVLVGTACALAAAWWDGHGPSRLGVAIYFVLVGIVDVLFLAVDRTPRSAILSLLTAAIAFAQAWVLLPGMGAAPDEGAPQTVA
ncbi:MAG: hypothetical protein QOE90_80 [Thermoplasmata archaeon]|nr:hypothetical protein [Thermoplasmata archaeon]